MTLRQWAVDGKIPFSWVGRERRFSLVEVENMKCGDTGSQRPRLEVLDGSVGVVRVGYEDRLARFGVGWLNRLFAVYGVGVEVLHLKRSGGRDEFLEDFVSLVSTFAGRRYGMGSGQVRGRLLAGTGRCPQDEGA